MTRERVFRKLQNMYWPFLIFFVSLVYILDVRYFSSPPIHCDDWAIIRYHIFGDFKFVEFSNRRPLLFTFTSLFTSIFDIKLQFHYLGNCLVIFLSAMLMYVISKKAFPKFPWLALPVALVYLVYPLDYSRTWATMFIAHFIWLIYLGIIFLLITYVRSGTVWHLLLAIFLFLVALLTGETALGIVMFTAIVLMFATNNNKRRLGLLSILFLGVFFILWRTIIQQQLMNVYDPYYDKLDFSMVTILYRYFRGFAIAIFAWIAPLLGPIDRNKYIILGTFGLCLIGAFLIILPRLIKLAKSNDSFPWNKKKRIIKSLLIIFLLGWLFWAAGYVPIISLRSPTFYGDATRDNLAVIPGVSISLVAGLSCLLTLVGKSINQVKKLTLVAVVPFILIGVYYQIWSQNERFKAWDEQKQLWNLMFEAVPGLKEESNVVILFPEYDQSDQFHFETFCGTWEAAIALKVLYNDETLQASYLYFDSAEDEIDVIQKEQDWSNDVFLYYDSTKPVIEVVDVPWERLAVSFQLPGYDPSKRIDDWPSKSTPYRWLVK
jgi:hypothetical protein